MSMEAPGAATAPALENKEERIRELEQELPGLVEQYLAAKKEEYEARMRGFNFVEAAENIEKTVAAENLPSAMEENKRRQELWQQFVEDPSYAPFYKETDSRTYFLENKESLQDAAQQATSARLKFSDPLGQKMQELAELSGKKYEEIQDAYLPKEE